MRFRDIESYTPRGNYRVNVSLSYLESYIGDQEQCREGMASLDQSPDFQREHVWDDAQRVAFVEHLLRGGRSGLNIYTNCPGWGSSYKGPYVVVDGKQRIHACLGFVRNEFPVFGSVYYRDFDIIPIQISLLWHVNELETRQEVLQWYLDLNTGGVLHTSAELDKVRHLLDLEDNPASALSE